MRYTLRTLKDEAAKIGATVEVCDGWMISINVDTPPGKAWCAIDGHCLTSASCPGGGATAYVVKDLLERMALGMDDCTDEDCEYCNPPEVSEAVSA